MSLHRGGGGFFVVFWAQSKAHLGDIESSRAHREKGHAMLATGMFGPVAAVVIYFALCVATSSMCYLQSRKQGGFVADKVQACQS